MRTTLTLDDDVAAKLRELSRKTGKSFKALVNDLLRLGLNAPRAAEPSAPYRLRARPMRARPGIDLSNPGELLEQIDGPEHK